MNRYDFNILSPVEFEEFIRDILLAECGLVLESFADGPDSGIDLRHASVKDAVNVIVQCKRYKNASSLMSDLKKERAKIDKMEVKPSRYIIATTVELSVTMIDKVFELFSPYMLEKSDIFRPKKTHIDTIET